MGEAPEHVYWVGSLGADNIASSQAMALQELENSIGFGLGGSFLLVTFHPVTKEPGEAEHQTRALLSALGEVIDRHNVLFTLPNSDTDGRTVAGLIQNWANAHPEKACAVTSLGRSRYYSALKHCTAVVGNSSSGLVEAPSFRKPTLNIGSRQKGRTQGNTVVNCAARLEDIRSGLSKVLDPETRVHIAENGINPYAKVGTLEAIHSVLVETTLPAHATKHFYDINF